MKILKQSVTDASKVEIQKKKMQKQPTIWLTIKVLITSQGEDIGLDREIPWERYISLEKRQQRSLMIIN